MKVPRATGCRMRRGGLLFAFVYGALCGVGCGPEEGGGAGEQVSGAVREMVERRAAEALAAPELGGAVVEVRVADVAAEVEALRRFAASLGGVALVEQEGEEEARLLVRVGGGRLGEFRRRLDGGTTVGAGEDVMRVHLVRSGAGGQAAPDGSGPAGGGG